MDRRKVLIGACIGAIVDRADHRRPPAADAGAGDRPLGDLRRDDLPAICDHRRPRQRLRRRRTSSSRSPAGSFSCSASAPWSGRSSRRRRWIISSPRGCSPSPRVVPPPPRPLHAVPHVATRGAARAGVPRRFGRQGRRDAGKRGPRPALGRREGRGCDGAARSRRPRRRPRGRGAGRGAAPVEATGLRAGDDRHRAGAARCPRPRSRPSRPETAAEPEPPAEAAAPTPATDDEVAPPTPPDRRDRTAALGLLADGVLVDLAVLHDDVEVRPGRRRGRGRRADRRRRAAGRQRPPPPRRRACPDRDCAARSSRAVRALVEVAIVSASAGVYHLASDASMRTLLLRHRRARTGCRCPRRS